MSRFINAPWADYAERIVIQTTDYLDYDGRYSAGGRQRFIRDLAYIIKNQWGRDLLIVQKGARNFELICDHGFHVLGIKSNLRSYGDPAFAHRVLKMVKRLDGLIYASGEDAWPFFRLGAKAIQHGVWWDGPQSWCVRFIQKQRVISCMKAIRSMLCVDTNFVNWLRCQGDIGYRLCEKCVYIPNYADTDAIIPSRDVEGEENHLRLICARRYEEKRGIDLFIHSLAILGKEGFPFRGSIFTTGGVAALNSIVKKLSLSEKVNVQVETMDGILRRYAESDVAVIPTLWSEGTSLACIEALCSGLPVIATPVGGLGNIVIPGFNGFIVPPIPEALASAIRRFSDREYLRNMKNNCLSLRPSLGIESWRQGVLSWLCT